MRSCDSTQSSKICESDCQSLGIPTTKTNHHVLPSRYYQTRTTKNKNIVTHPKRLFLPDIKTGAQLHVFTSSAKQLPVYRLHSRWNYRTLRSLNNLSSGLQPEKKLTKQNPGMSAAEPEHSQGLRWAQSPRGLVWHNLFEFAKWKGPLFQSPFQRDKGSARINSPAAVSDFSISECKNKLCLYISCSSTAQSKPFY